MSGRGIRAIRSVEDFVEAVRKDSAFWHPKEPRWFRGEPIVNTALTPTLYRDGFAPHENGLLQMFRARATGFHQAVPAREHTDQWLFLARHARLPTRLLDWSEGALIALSLHHVRDNSLCLGMTPAESTRRSKICAELGSIIVAACGFRLRFNQHTSTPD
jgi:hypothetical protein